MEQKIINEESLVLLTRYAAVCGETNITTQRLIWFALRGGADNE